MDQPRYHDDPFDESDALFDEKPEVNKPTTPRKGKRYSKAQIFIFFVVFGTLHWLFIDQAIKAFHGWSRRLQIVASPLEFEDITPNEKLQWHPCKSGNFFCARLTVPMDYNRPLNASKDNPKVHIALLMVPGKHNNPNEYSVSPLLINPGGPGGSGTLFSMILATGLQYIVGSDRDVIGFDPRGIGSTTPRIDCFSDPYDTSIPNSPYDFGAVDYLNGFYKRMSWLITGTQIGLINSSSDALSKLDVRARTLGKLCEQKDSLYGNNSIFKHLHTPNVARDMISIIDAWDEWRDSLNSQSASPRVQEDKDESAKSKYSLDTKGKLVYWGFSYGTLLGATFSAMFPDRIGRVVLDGVVDADVYVSPVWAEAIINTDPIFESFTKYCYEGKEKCKLYRPGDTLSDIETRFDDVQTNLRAQPLTFIGPYNHYPYIFTINELKMIFFSTLYAPNRLFELMALIIDAIIREDYYLLEAMFPLFPREALCDPLAESLYPGDAQISIVCGDKRYPLNETTAHIEKRFEKMSKFSSFADVWLSLMMGCDGWSIDTIDPPMRWGKHPAHKEKPINTSFPVLFLSNTYDPVTPLKAGVKMAGLFVDAGIIEQKSMGHCSLSALSFCMNKKVRAYFQEGRVPPPPVKGKELKNGKWERCEADEWPFHPYEGGLLKGGEMSEKRVQEEEMAKVSQEIQKAIVDYNFFRHDKGHGMPKVQNAKCSTRAPGH